jgi:hypothetical protein
MADSLTAATYCRPVFKTLCMRDYLLSIGIILIALSLSPVVLVEAEILPARIFYIVFMPVFLLYVLVKGNLRINTIIISVLWIQIFIIVLVALSESTADISYLYKTMGILVSVGFISVFFSSDLLDMRIFVKVVVLFSLGILLLAVLSTVFAFLGYIDPIPLFSRTEGGEVVYRVGCTFSNEVALAGAGYFIRPSGVFSEPGMLAMHVILAIITNALVLDNRKYELLLILFGLFTSTLSFYLFLFVFFVLFKRWKALAFFALVILCAVVIIPLVTNIEDTLVWQVTMRRIKLFFGEGFGSNRYRATMEVLSNLGKLNILGCVSLESFNSKGAEATIFGPFLAYGLVGGLFAYLHIFLFVAIPFFMCCKSPNRRVSTRMLAIFTLLLLNLFHRPFTYHFLYYIYVIVLFEWEWRRSSAPTIPESIRNGGSHRYAYDLCNS